MVFPATPLDTTVELWLNGASAAESYGYLEGAFLGATDWQDLTDGTVPAGKFSYIVVDWFNAGANLAAIRADHPNAKILAYQNFAGMRIGPHTNSRPSSLITQEEAAATSESWFLHSGSPATSANRITFSGFPDLYAANVGSASWRTQARSHLDDILADGFDGVMLDDLNAFKSHWSGDIEFATDNDYRDAAAAAVVDLFSYADSIGCLLFANVGGDPWDGDHRTGFTAFLAGLHGWNRESYHSWSSGISSVPFDGSAFAELQEMVAEAEAAGVASMLEANELGPVDHFRMQAFGNAAWLLEWGGVTESAYAYNNGEPANIHSRYRVLGTPTQSKQYVAGSVDGSDTAWMRRWGSADGRPGGIVCVNARTGGGTVTFNLGGSYIDLDGNIVTSIDLDPGYGNVLLAVANWTDITSLVYGRDPVTITRGRSSEGAQTDRSTCRATVNNRSGDLSPRNPVGTYYGLIGRNTPMRVHVAPADAYVLITNNLEDISTPDSTGLSITGDLDVRLDLEREDWTNIIGLCGKWGAAGQRSWQLVINADHTLSLLWSADGTTELTATSTAAATISDGDRIALRATIDVDNGAAGRTVTFYTASTIDGSWSQLGSPVTTAGVTSIFDSTADVQIGELDNGAYFGPIGRVYGFELYSGIAGTLRADLNFTDRPPTGTPLVDSVGNTWTPDEGTSFIDPGCRFLGEISDWPQRWDVSGTDIHVPLEASGIMRRLSQGSTLLHSTMYRGITALANQPKAYWPCEDGADATVIASAVPGGSPMTLKSVVVGARPGFGQHTDFKCSAPLPTMGESQWTGLVSSYSPTGIVRVWFLLHVPAAGAIDGESIIHVVLSGGTTARWRITYGTGGTLALRAFDADQNEIFTTGALGFNVDGVLCRIALELEQDGADVDYSLALLEVGESVALGSSGTVTSETIGRCSAIVINPGADLDDVAVGHIQVHDDNSSVVDLFEELNAYSGEAAGRRIERLCEEESVSFRAVGDLDATTAMGYQLPHTLFQLLRECEDTDGGILFEPRDMLGLAYRTRESMYDQDPALVLDYSANDLSGIEPIDDDQHVRNDITVTRTGGSSVRAVQEDGPLSIEAPPAGVGRYDEGVTVSLETDLQLDDHAGWRLHLGTVDEARYPTLQVDLTRSNFIGANLAQTSAVQDLDLGDRLTVENPPAWLPPDDITQLAQGFVEVLANFTHTVDINCSPESPWSQAATYDAADAHYSSDGTTLAEDLDTTETAVDISTPSGPVWDDADAPYDWLVGGEVMTVTAISGTGASQTATVTRSVNGVVKTHASGATVELAHPSVYVE